MIRYLIPTVMTTTPTPTFRYRLGHSYPPNIVFKRRIYAYLLLAFSFLMPIFIWIVTHANSQRWISETAELLVRYIVYLTIVSASLSSLYYVLVGRNFVSLTSLQNTAPLSVAISSETDMPSASYILAQVRSWHVNTLEIAIRVASAITVLLLLYDGISLNYPQAIRDPYILYYLGVMVALIAIFVLDAVWRMRAFTALGLAIRAKIHSQAFAILANLGFVVCFYVIQIGLVGVLWNVILAEIIQSEGTFAFWGIPLAVALFCVLHYIFYVSLQNITFGLSYRVFADTLKMNQ